MSRFGAPGCQESIKTYPRRLSNDIARQQPEVSRPAIQASVACLDLNAGPDRGRLQTSKKLLWGRNSLLELELQLTERLTNNSFQVAAMPDIRNFFSAKGSAPPSKPAPKKEAEVAKKPRGSACPQILHHTALDLCN
jgi:hypothetical protein